MRAWWWSMMETSALNAARAHCICFVEARIGVAGWRRNDDVDDDALAQYTAARTKFALTACVQVLCRCYICFGGWWLTSRHQEMALNRDASFDERRP